MKDHVFPDGWLRRIALTAALAIGGLLSLTSAAQAPAVVKITAVRLVSAPDRPEVFFPKKKTSDAMMIVRVTVEPDGKPSRFEIIDGFYNAAYRRGASAYALAMHYAPEQRDGKAARGQLTFRLLFQLADRTEGSRRMLSVQFQEALGEAVRLIDADDPVAAQVQIEQMVSGEVSTLYEYARMEAALAESFERAGQSMDAAEHCDLALTHRRGQLTRYVPGAGPARKLPQFLLEEPMLTDAARRCIVLEAGLGRDYKAMSRFGHLASLGALSPDDPLSQLSRSLEARLADAAPLRARARVKRYEYVEHAAYRRVIGVANVRNGSLRVIRTRCGTEQRELAIVEGRRWQLPEKWRECLLEFHGDAGTEFDIIEVDESPDAIPVQ
jgi:hypothetical protein